MSPVYIKTRTGKTGKRYLVYWRRGGRGFKEQFAGSFKTQKDAKTRRDFIAGELAGGRDPQAVLDMLRAGPAVKPRLDLRWDIWTASKRKVGEAAQRGYGNSKAWWVEVLGANVDPHTITVPMVSAGLDLMLDELAPATVGQYLSHLAMMLDFELPDGTPNPARSKKLELPAAGPQQRPPSSDEWATIQKRIAARSRTAVDLMEACALRVAEACGVEAGDKDIPGGQVLIRREVTKTKAGRRWVPVPEALMDALPLTVKPTEVNYDLRKACRDAGLDEWGSRAFRRRRISLWYAQGFDPPTIARWAGHTKASESMDTYAFEVMDALSDPWLGFWQAVYRGSGAAQVRHGEGVPE